MAEPFIQPIRRGGLCRLVAALDVLLAAGALAGVAALALEYGFGRPPVAMGYLHLAEAAIVAVFVMDRLARLAAAPRRATCLRENMVDFVLMAAALAGLTVSFRTVLSAGTLYVIITHAYLLMALVLRGVSLNLRLAGGGIHPGWLLVGGFAFLILAGSGLLMLPVSVRSEYLDRWYYVDALFTATSATCVTGLVVANTGGHFTAFGQAVILVLIQCGGLGIMLFGTVLGMLMGKALTVKQPEAMEQMVSPDAVGKIGRLAASVIVVTFALELAGAACLYPMFLGQFDTAGRPLAAAGAVWHSIFHSVSAFCSAGFALYGNNMVQGVREGWSRPLRDCWQVIGVIAPLIVLGGLGFPVLANCWQWARGGIACLVRRQGTVPPSMSPRPRLSLHTRIVLTTSLALIVTGAVVLLLVEPRGREGGRSGKHLVTVQAPGQAGEWSSMPPARRAREAVFQSISARTAGFNTIDLAELSNAGKLWMCVLMVIGGSPASTAGGMKTATFAVIVLIAASQIRRRREVEAFHRSIPAAVAARAVTLATLYLALVGTITMLLCVAQGPGFRFMDLLVEACSACGTVGLSTGVTSSLSCFGKSVVMAGMFIGRVGPLTLLAAVAGGLKPVGYAYPAEEVIIG